MDAERLLDDAKEAESIANRAAKAVPKAKGGAGRATGLRTYYRAEITDRTEFAKWLWINRESEMDGFLHEQADKQVARDHDTQVPGVIIHVDKRAV